MGSGGGSSAPAPDPQIGQAALMNAKLGRQWLSFARDAFDQAQIRQKPIDRLSREIAETQLGTMRQQNRWARDAHDRYTDVFQPLQDRFIAEAEGYDSPEKMAEASAAARADVMSAAASERDTARRQMTAMGVNPNSGRFAGMDRAVGLGTAVAAAGAENAARRDVRNTGMAMRAGAINMGNGLPAQAAGSIGLGMNAGAGAMGARTGANQQFLASTGIMGQGYQGAMSGYANQANILQNQYNSQLAAWNAQNQQNAGLFEGIGALAGTLFGGAKPWIFSAKDAKTDKKPAKRNLEAVEEMPVERWRYMPGIGDGGAAEHVGPYAEDFKAATGKGDGRVIPMQDAIGITMGAVKELSAKVDRLDKKVVGLGTGARKAMKEAA